MSKTILIVDDSKTERVVLNGYLKSAYSLFEAASGEEAIEILHAQWRQISAIVLDIIMPGMDGFETLQVIKANAQWLQIPVVITTGLNDEDSREKAIALGADSFVSKPFNRNLLLHVVDNAVKLREMALMADQIKRDSLTGLLNRDSFFTEAERMIRRRAPGYYMLSCMDIENFKVTNDQYGTETGDAVLIHIAQALNGFVGNIKGLCGRYMADMFAILYPAEMRDSDAVAENHAILTTPPCVLRPIHIRIGRYLVDDISLPVSAMFDRAVLAEEMLKGRYDAYIGEYNEKMRLDLLREQQIVGDMVGALENGEFVPWFQPQYNHATGALIGAEALVRWQRDGKIIPPNDFIPVFEKNGFIYEVDKSVWRQVCAQLRRWIDAGKEPLPISVNVSRHDLYQPDFMQTICGLLDEYGLPIDLLCLEITESAFSDSTNVITSMVGTLIEHGFTVEIDDFGSGYSSLNTLKDVPASILKLDMRFFEATQNTERSGNIVESVVRMAKWLGMAVIAEGVENKAQADYLRTIGSYYIQGYYYARPMPVGDYEAEMEKRAKESKLSRMETLETLDSNLFWDPKSMETLIFNSYVGGACIFEYSNGNIELLRINEQYISQLHGLIPPDAKLGEASITRFLDAAETAKAFAAIESAIRDRCESSAELRLTNAGQTEYIRMSGRVIARADNRVLCYGVIHNLTEQRAAEQSALINAERISAILDNTKCGIIAYTVAPLGKTPPLFINNRLYELLGYTREQFEQEVASPFECISQDDREMYVSKLLELSEIGQSAAMHIRAIRRDGRMIWLRADITIVKFADVPQPVQLGNFLDITEQIEAEQKRAEAAKQLQIIMGNVNGSVSALVMDDAGNTTPIFCNEKYYELYGYTKEQAEEIQLDVMSCILPEDFADVLDKFNRLKRNGAPINIDYRAKKRDGSVIFVRCIASRISMDGYGNEVIVAVATDFTEQQTLQDQLRAVIENINGGVSVTHMRGDKPEFLLVNESYFEIIGYSRDQFHAEITNAFDIVHPDDRDRIKKLFKDSEAEQKRYTMEYRIVRRNGAIRHVLCNTTVMQLFGMEEPVQLSVVNDITMLREAQQKEHDVSAQMQAILDNIGGGICATVIHNSDDVEILFVNDGFYGLFGYSREQLASQLTTELDIILPQDREKVRETILRIILEHGCETYEFRCRKRGGSLMWVQGTSTVISLPGVSDTVLLTTVTDVTELHLSQQRNIATTDRLRAVMNAMSSGVTAVAFRGTRTEFLFANNNYYKMHGIVDGHGNQHDLSASLAMICPEDRARMQALVLGATEVGQIVEAEFSVLLPDGVVRREKVVINVTQLVDVDVPVQVSIYTDITAEKAATDQLRFLNDTARDIIAEPDAEKAIHETLQRINGYFSADRSYVVELDKARLIASNTYEICAAGVEPQKANLQQVAYQQEDSWYKALCNQGYLIIEHVDALDDGQAKLREMLLPQGIHSLIIVALKRGGELTGFVGADNPATAMDQVMQLTGIADNLSMLLNRRNMMRKIDHGNDVMQTLMSDTPGGFLRMRIMDGRNATVVSFNPGFCTMLGMTGEEIMAAYGDDAYKCLFAEDVEAVTAEAADALRVSGQYSQKCRLKKKDGDLIWVQVFGRFVKGEDGEQFFNAYFTDIAAQKNAEQLAIELLDNMPAGAALYEYNGKDLKIIHLNKRYWELVGREATDYGKTSPVSAIHPDDRALVAQEIESAIRNHRDITVDIRVLHGGGGYRPFHIIARAEQQGSGRYLLYASYAPISDEAMSIQKMLPIALSTIVSSSDDLSYVKDRDLRYICVSQSIATLAGFQNTRDFIGKTAEEIFTEPFAHKFNEDDRQIIETGEAVINELEHLPLFDGTVCLARTSKFPILDANGSAVGVYCVSRDITAQKENESQLALLTSSIPGGLAAYSLSNNGFAPLYFNDGYFAYSGYTREEYIAMTAQEPLALVFEEDRAKLRDILRTFAAKRQDGMTGECTYRCKTKSGGTRWMSLKAVLSQVGEDAFILNVVQLDVTKMREADLQLKLLSDSIPGGIATFRCMPGNIENVYFNDGVCTLTGYSREEFETHAVTMLDIIFDEDRAVIHEQIERLMAGETNLNFTVRIHAKDKMKWVNSMARTTGHTGEIYNASVVLTDVTAQQEERERLRLANEEYRIATLHANRTICRYDIATQTLTITPDAAKRFALPEQICGVPYERVRLGKISEETHEAYIAFFESIMRGEKENAVVYCKQLPGGWRWIKARATTVFDDGGKPYSAIISFVDITEQREKEAIYSRWQNSIAERPKDSYTLFRCNLSKRSSYESWEGELLHLTFKAEKQTFDERTDEFMEQCVYADDRDRYRAFLRADTMLAEYYLGHRTDSIEFRQTMQDGKTRWLRLSIDLVEYPDSPDVQVYLMYEDIDEQKRAQQSIIERAETDPLTGILNRATFTARANRIMSESKPGTMHALLMLDIDGFKRINDVFGHGAGDQALIEIADVMTRSSRKEDLVGRLGGDEFVLFLPDIFDETAAAAKARQLLDLIGKDLGMDVRISASIGVALFPQDGEGFEALYKAADNVLYRVKDGGKNGYAFTHDDAVFDRDSSEWTEPQKRSEAIWSSLRRILIVDDSQIDMDMLFKIFSDDFRVEKAMDGATALAKLRHYGTAISAVLLDLHLPDMDGYAVMQKMQQNETTCTIPVIVVTADEQRETALKVIRAGADDLIVKPVDADILRVRVEAAISRTENERQRVQNNYLSLRNTEINSYKSVLERSGIVVITLDWGKNEFHYSPSVPTHLAGEYDGKKFWSALLSNMAADSQTVRQMQQLVHDIAEDRTRLEGNMTARLRTASGAYAPFEMHVYKENNRFGLAERMIIALKEMTPAQRENGEIGE